MGDKTDKLAVTVQADVKEIIEQYAQQKGCSLGEALDRIVVSWVGRQNAVRKWAQEHAAAAEGKPVKKAKKTPAAKKAKKVKAEAAAAQ